MIEKPHIKWWKENGEERNKKRKKERDFDKAYYMFTALRRRTRRNGIEFSLTEDWFRSRTEKGVCELSGIPFNLHVTGRGSAWNSPTVDRINPTGGYTKDNCRMILWHLNRALSKEGEDLLLKIVRSWLTLRGEFHGQG